MTAPDYSGVQRRTLRVLVSSQIFGGIGVVSGIAVGGLVVADVMGRPDLAGLVQTAQVLGAAALAIPASKLARLYGRRAGLGLGLLCGGIGATLAVISAQLGWLPLLLIGAALCGGGQTAGLQARYAAMDLASADRRARSLSFVVWATTIGAISGPNLVDLAGQFAGSIGLQPLSGGYLIGATAMTAAAFVIGFGLNPDPLKLARQLNNQEIKTPAQSAAEGNWRRLLGNLIRTPSGALGLLAVVLAHTIMVSVMVMTPVHMHHGGASLSVIGMVISGHVAGMYAFSPVAGWLSDRYGRAPTIVAGALILLVASVLAGNSPPGMSHGLPPALFLLGLGWSFCLISGSALLSESTPQENRAATQGVSDSLMGIAAGGGGACAGVIVHVGGYGALNAGTAVLSVALLAGAALLLIRSARRAREEPSPAE